MDPAVEVMAEEKEVVWAVVEVLESIDSEWKAPSPVWA